MTAARPQPPDRQPASQRMAVTIVVAGRVQGVGYRPFVYRTALRHAVCGRVRNLSGEVLIQAEGDPERLRRFTVDLTASAPPLARPVIASIDARAPAGWEDFAIEASASSSSPRVDVPPDVCICDACLAELEDPGDRRYRYPFITCTQCGPRYTLIEALPFDRARTSMAVFEMCGACRAEYDDPAGRRFHAETIACAACGPRLAFVRPAPARALVEGDEVALRAAAALLAEGGIVAVKGIGGYHLMCDAASDEAVARLRSRKQRPAKPVAVMFPALDVARRSVVVDGPAQAALTSPARPIVLARRRADCPLSRALAPGLDELGVVLPYSPLHHLLLADFGGPLVATSANISGEPVLTEPREAERRLAAVADAFLHHDRAIVRPAEDGVVRVHAGRARTVRLGRGAAPLEIALEQELGEPVLAMGGHMKVALALGAGRRALLWPHLGDLDSPRAMDLLIRQAAELPALYGITPRRIACDLHPGFATSRWASRQGLGTVWVQHHAAHASALVADNPGIGRWLVFAWDGVGLGDDGTLWGGEALLGRPGSWRRVASFRPFRPPGGDLAAHQPWRSAAALLWETGREHALPVPEAHLRMARTAWERGINAPPTSAVGRLLDAAAALLLNRMETSYEGQGPMELEALARSAEGSVVASLNLPIAPDESGVLRTDWAPLLPLLADDAIPAPVRAKALHWNLARALVTQVEAIATMISESGSPGLEAVGLTGGVFQNRILAEAARTELAKLNIRAFLPHAAPAGDGGLALGQIVEAAALLERGAA